jgi:hypothetical protein
MNSVNVGARIMRNGDLDQKIWAMEAFRGKMVFLGGPRVILEFLEWLEGLGAKDRAPANFGDFRGFCGIFEGLGPICKYFQKQRALLEFL